MLRHNVFDGIHIVRQMIKHILGLNSAKVFKPLKEISLIFASHLVNLFGRQSGGKFLIIRKTPTVPLGDKRINQLIHIAVCCSVIAQNLPIQIQENFIEGIGGNFADVPAEQIVLHDPKDLVNLLFIELSCFVQSQHFHQERPGDGNFQPIHPSHALVQLCGFFQTALAGEEFFIQPGILSHIL